MDFGFWILDFGATVHLARSSEHFVSYIPYVGNETIRIAVCSLVPIAGNEKISPYAELSIHNILHVPRLSYNFLSISNIIHELNCKPIFLPDFVSFQDLS